MEDHNYYLTEEKAREPPWRQRQEEERRRRERRRQRKTWVNIGAAFLRWRSLMWEKNFHTDAEMACFLLESYARCIAPMKRRPLPVKPPTVSSICASSGTESFRSLYKTNSKNPSIHIFALMPSTPAPATSAQVQRPVRRDLDVQQLLGIKGVPPERSPSLDQKDPEPLHLKEEQADPEPLHLKEEQADPEPLHLKEEQVDPEPLHLKEEQVDPEPLHLKEEQADPEPINVKEEQEDPVSLHIKEEEEDTDITRFTAVIVKSEDEEEKPQSSELRQIQTGDSREAEPPIISSDTQIKTETDAQDCRDPKPARNLDPHRHSQPNTDDGKASDSSETEDSDNGWQEPMSDSGPETEDGASGWMETRTAESAVNALKYKDAPIKLFCCFCGIKLEKLPKFCGPCGRDVSKIIKAAPRVTRAAGEDRGSLQTVTKVTDVCAIPPHSAVLQFLKNKELKERTTFLKLEKKSENTVKIFVGIMSRTSLGLEPTRGKTLSLHVYPQWSSRQVLSAAVKRQKDFNKDIEDGRYVLLYPDGSRIKNIPGSDTPFTVELYKEATGKAYHQITLYICILEDVLRRRHLPERRPKVRAALRKR